MEYCDTTVLKNIVKYITKILKCRGKQTVKNLGPLLNCLSFLLLTQVLI